jgi:hypothetical protein
MLAGFVDAAAVNGKLHHFITRHMANDPKVYGRKARAYKAASAAFGGGKGLSRQTIDRRIAIFKKHGPAMNTALQDGKRFKARLDPDQLVRRLRSAFAPEELAVLLSERIAGIPTWFAERILIDRETANAATTAKTRRK